MKLGTIIAFAAMFASAAAFAGQGAVQFEVVLLRDGKVVRVSVPGTDARFVVKPTMVSLPQTGG